MSLWRVLALMLAIWLVAVALSGCVMVTVQADGGKPRLSLWPAGVRVERGSADAVAVQYAAIGASAGCGAVSIGVASGWCVVIDARTCGVALVEVDTPRTAVKPPAARQLTEVSDLVRAQCLHTAKEGQRP